MVGAVEREFCTAGDGAELPYDQLVVVDGIVVQDIILFELPRISKRYTMHKMRTVLLKFAIQLQRNGQKSIRMQ